MEKERKDLPAERQAEKRGVTAVRRIAPVKKSGRERALAAAKRFFSQFGTAIIAVSIVAYVFLQLMLNVGTMIETETAAYASISDRAELTAFLFRDEKAIPSGAEGTDCVLVEEGEKVRKGQDVAVTYSDPADVEAQNRIGEIDKRLEVLRKSSLPNGALTTNISVLDSQIAELTLALLRRIDDGALDRALREKEELLILLNRRQSAIKENSYAAEISALTAEKKELERSLTGENYRVVAPESGYYYSAVDGYENAFTVAALESLTGDDFDRLSDSVPDENVLNGSSGKIVTDSTWYIALALDKRTAESYRSGANYPITFQYSGGTVLNMTLERRINRTDRDMTILVFSTKTLPESFDYSRSQTVELTRASYEGLRISTKALRVRDGVTGVYVVTGSRVTFKETEVIYTYGGHCICSIPADPDYPKENDIAYSSKKRLSLHDTVITEGNDIYDGMRIT